MDPTKKEKVLNSIWTLLTAVVVVGPFALPLLWRNPHYKKSTKIFWSIVIVGITAFLLVGTGKLFQELNQQIQELNQLN